MVRFLSLGSLRSRALALGACALVVQLALAPAAHAQDPPAPAPAAGGNAQDEADLGLVYKQTVPVGGTELPVEEIVRAVGEQLHKNITIDEGLKGKKIKFYTSAELTFNMLKSILQTYGVDLVFEVVDGRTLLHAALQRNEQTMFGYGPTPFYNDGEKLPGAEQVVTAVYTVKYTDPNSIQTAIRAAKTRDPRRVGDIIAVPKSPVLIITDFSSSVTFYLKIAAALDVATPTFTYKIVQVQYALADELAALINTLQRTLETGGGGGAVPGQPGQPPGQPRVNVGGAAGGQAGAGQAQVVADVRTNKVVILALPDEVAAIERLIREMDIKVEARQRRYNVYHCINTNAIDLASRLNELFTGVASAPSRTTQTTQPGSTLGRNSGTSFGRQGLNSRTGLGQQSPFGNQQQQQQNVATQPATSFGGGAAGSQTRSRAQLNPGEGLLETRIVADEQTNSLLIQANAEDYREIIAIIEKLDRKRLRVMIEAQVWEIDITDDIVFAIDTALTSNPATHRLPQPLRSDVFSNFGLLAPTPGRDALGNATLGIGPNLTGSLAQGGLIFALTHGAFDKIPLILQALETNTKANLLTTPFCVTNDGQQANFAVNQIVPFQVTSALVGSGSFQGFDQATASSQLQIRPRISSGNNLTLEISLDISSFTDVPQPGAPPPSNERQYTGTVTVPNREYMVFGGLELDSVTEKHKTIPLLGDIPILGYLFGSTTHRKERRRIYVFVRPVIFTDEDFDDERKAGKYARDVMRGESLLGEHAGTAVIPDDVLDAQAPGTRSVVYGLLGDGGTLGVPEDPKTVQMRRAIGGKK